jgi:dTDP-4-dehydrorhamnose reductase
MRWAVIGANGMLGSELIEFLMVKGEDVRGFHRGNLDLSRKNKHLAQDLGDFDIVVNTAAYTNVDRAELEPETAFFSNATIPQLLSQASDRNQSRFLHISTDYVFRGDSAVPYKTSDEPDPISFYGKSKLEGERLSLAYSETQVIRTAWLYGRNGLCFPRTISTKLVEGENLKIVGDQIGSPTSAKNLAEFIFHAGTQSSESKILHAVSYGSTSWFDFALEIANSVRARPSLITKVSSEALGMIARRPMSSLLEPSALLGFTMPAWKDSWRKESEELLRFWSGPKA